MGAGARTALAGGGAPTGTAAPALSVRRDGGEGAASEKPWSPRSHIAARAAAASARTAAAAGRCHGRAADPPSRPAPPVPPAER